MIAPLAVAEPNTPPIYSPAEMRARSRGGDYAGDLQNRQCFCGFRERHRRKTLNFKTNPC